MATVASILSKQDQLEIVEAIHRAEHNSPGEIRVYFEKRCKTEPMKRAVQIFHKLKMQHTKHRTGILFYLAYVDHQFAIIGDKGIHEKVEENFWHNVKAMMEAHFKEGRYKHGLVEGINKVGEMLHLSSGASEKSEDELPNDIVMGDE